MFALAPHAAPGGLPAALALFSGRVLRQRARLWLRRPGVLP